MRKTVFIAALFVASCSDNSSTAPERTNGYTHDMKTKEDSLFQEVMDGHDAAMAKMGKLAGLRKEATKKADSLAESSANGKLTTSLRMAAQNLQASENKMNAWMEGFSIDSAKDNKNKRIAYLESEKIKVNSVKDEMLGAIAVADSLLKK
jgi:hypothetical protein